MLKLNPALPSDVSTVLDAAALLDTSEFNIFSIAYHEWFGTDASTKTLEKYFAAYMFNSVVPHWARHFARTIIRLSKTGNLNPDDFVESSSPPSPKSIFIARTFIFSGIVIMFVLLLGAYFASLNSPFIDGCFFPPCY